MRIHGRDVDVRRFTWSEPPGELHIDILKLMREFDIPWSEENERQVVREVIAALHQNSPGVPVHHVVDRERPAKPRGQ